MIHGTLKEKYAVGSARGAHASDQLPLHAVSGRLASLRHRRGTLLPLFASATPVGAAGGWRPRPPRMQLKYNPRTLRVP